MNKNPKAEEKAETFVIALHQGKTFVGYYVGGDNLPTTDRNKAYHFSSFNEVKQGAAWVEKYWFRIFGYNVKPLMLTNYGI